MKKQKLVSDFVTVAGGFLKSVEGAKDYSKTRIKNKISMTIEDMKFVKKNELEEIKAMIIKSRTEVDSLKKKIINLEKKLLKKGNK